MKVSKISHIPYSHRVGRYRIQMAQAKLQAPVDPIVSYSLQPFYTREQQWITELSASLSRLYRYSSALDHAAREFDPERRNSAVGQRLAISSDPETATAEARSHARTRQYLLDHIRVAHPRTKTPLPEGSSSDLSAMAEVVVDGVPLRFPANQFSLGNGEVQVRLHQDGTAPVTISVVPDTDRMLRQTRVLVDCYNRLQTFLDEHGATISTQKLDTFSRVAQAAGDTLRRYGISLQADGLLTLDEALLRSTVQARHAEFVDDMKGLSQQFREEILRVQKVPSGAFSRSFDHVVSAKPYLRSSPASLRYLHAASKGLFFNVLF
ncbi:hypothetical protein ACFSO0_04855 [Brevibacillus sp. GCM10020057]|uniref:hypothetical protein n=1 Tax=Brevibacillus sp. GCM10020057 TaxID=3317327 RepID=UPI003625C0C0